MWSYYSGGQSGDTVDAVAIELTGRDLELTNKDIELTSRDIELTGGDIEVN